ncbi:MAG: SHD1 domain-containing protein, partial [Thermoguttaceae bacterium]
KKYLIDSYSLHPFATAELEALLKEHKVDDALAKEVLDAVKEAEKNAPPPSDYRNWQTKDGLFKASAKYVSSDGKDVTIEKPDGKQTTIELSALRKADQDYVREQIETAKP